MSISFESEKNCESDVSKSTIDTRSSSEISIDCYDMLSSKDLALSSLDYLEQEVDSLSDADAYLRFNSNVIIISCRDD